jgi:hypothetical protein
MPSPNLLVSKKPAVRCLDSLNKTKVPDVDNNPEQGIKVTDTEILHV